jgi:hypothetical protein
VETRAWQPSQVRGFPHATNRNKREIMNIFYIIGVVVVVLFVLGYFGLR